MLSCPVVDEGPASAICPTDVSLCIPAQTLAIRERFLGDALPTATCRYNLAVVALHEDRLEQALELADKALTTRMRVLGPSNPATARAKALTGEVYLKLRRMNEAATIFQVGAKNGRAKNGFEIHFVVSSAFLELLSPLISRSRSLLSHRRSSSSTVFPSAKLTPACVPRTRLLRRLWQARRRWARRARLWRCVGP
jgi:hypothetical protein